MSKSFASAAAVLSLCLLFAVLAATPAFADGHEKIKGNFIVFGNLFQSECYVTKDDKVFISAEDPIVEKICSAAGASLDVNKRKKTLSVTKGSHSGFFERKDGTSLYMREKGRQFLAVSLDNLGNLLDFSYVLDSGDCLIYPLVSEIKVIESDKDSAFSLESGSPIKSSPNLKCDGNGIFITVKGLALKPDFKLPDHKLFANARIHNTPGSSPEMQLFIPSLTQKDVEEAPRTKETALNFKVNKVTKTASGKIEIPKADTAANTVKIPRQPRQTSSQTSNPGVPNELKTVEIVQSDAETLKITLRTSGPIDYKWSRFKVPDNRFFIDLAVCKNAGAAKETEINSAIAQKIRVGQLSPDADSACRIVFDLNLRADFEIFKDENIPEQLTVLFKNKNTVNTAMSGYGSTRKYDYSAAGSSGLTICIDPGHGGGDHGAVNPRLNLSEKNVTLNISMKLAEKLRSRGFNVVMTRDCDRDVTYKGSSDSEELNARVNAGVNCGASLYLSVHINASTNTAAGGISTHWCKPGDKFLASEIQAELIGATMLRDRGVVQDRFFVIKNSPMPAVLIEVGFISNDSEAKLLMQNDFLDKVADAIANGTCIYVTKYGGGNYANKKK